MLEGRATSLPKISSKVKLSQFQVLDSKGTNSRAALHYKHMSKWDHANLVEIKGILAKRSLETYHGQRSPRSSLNKEKVSAIKNMGSQKSLLNSVSNPSLFQTRQA